MKYLPMLGRIYAKKELKHATIKETDLSYFLVAYVFKQLLSYVTLMMMFGRLGDISRECISIQQISLTLVIRINMIMFIVYIGSINSLKDKDLINDKQCCLIIAKITMIATAFHLRQFCINLTALGVCH